MCRYLEIWESQPVRTLRACTGLLRDCFPSTKNPVEWDWWRQCLTRSTRRNQSAASSQLTSHVSFYAPLTMHLIKRCKTITETQPKDTAKMLIRWSFKIPLPYGGMIIWMMNWELNNCDILRCYHINMPGDNWVKHKETSIRTSWFLTEIETLDFPEAKQEWHRLNNKIQLITPYFRFSRRCCWEFRLLGC